MDRDKHPNKEIENALQYVERKEWRVKKSKGRSAHAWGQIYCPARHNPCSGGEWCITSVWSTPKSPANHAKQLKRMVDRCIKAHEVHKRQGNE